MEIFIITFCAFKNSPTDFDFFTVWVIAEDREKAAEKARAHGDRLFFHNAEYSDIRAEVAIQDKRFLMEMLTKTLDGAPTNVLIQTESSEPLEKFFKTNYKEDDSNDSIN